MNNKKDNGLYQQIDNYLRFLKKNDGGSVFDFETDYHSTIGRQAFEIMQSENLISYRGVYGSERSIIDITVKGSSILDQGGLEKFLAKKRSQAEQAEAAKELERKKTEVDFVLAKKMLKEYPKTKWFARIGFFVAILLLIIEIIRLMKEL